MNNLAISICGALAIGTTLNVYATPELGVDFKPGFQGYFNGATENLQSELQVTQSDNFSYNLQQSGNKQQSLMISEGTALKGNNRTFTVEQRGNKNDSMIEVTGWGNHTNVTINQSGRNQDQLTLIERGAHRNTVTVDQVNVAGNDDNWSKVHINRGDRNNIAVIQSGLKSESVVYVTGNASDRNNLNVDQNGEYHNSNIEIMVGERNLVDVNQSGSWHDSNIGIDGSNNDIDVSQSDYKNISDITLTNTSDFNHINIVQTGDLSRSYVSLDNSSGSMGVNTINVTQTGNDYSNMTVDSSNNITVNVTQN